MNLKKFLIVIFLLVTFCTSSFADDKFIYCAMWTSIGASTGFGVWWFVGTLQDDPEEEGDWVDHNDKLGSYVGVGALAGLFLGIVSYPENKYRSSFINFSLKDSLRIKVPEVKYDLKCKKIDISIIEFNF